jgi:hypothetical protein
MIRGDQVGINVADFPIFSLNPGEDESVEQDREALAARQSRHGLGRSPGLCKDLCVFRMIRAINVRYPVSPSG